MRKVTTDELVKLIDHGNSEIEWVKKADIPDRFKPPFIKAQQDLIDYYQKQLDAIISGNDVIEL